MGEMYRPYVYANNSSNNKGNKNAKRVGFKSDESRHRKQLKNFNGGPGLSGLPRKWVEFVFRRNADNSVYRSESFRFIQKTNSLEPLVQPKSKRLTRFEGARIPVSDDYVEPLDQLNALSGTHHSNLSSAPSSSLDQRWTSLTLTEVDEPPYHEIAEKYNAPYYYSDTLKGSPESKAPSYPLPPTLGNIQGNTDPSGVTPCSCSQSRSRDPPMARKRYETAFLPANSAPAPVSPDVDSLLSAIHIQSTSVTDEPLPRALTSGITVVTAQTHVQYSRPKEVEENWPTQTTPSPPQKHMPLSEPLPQKKRFEFVQGGCDSSLSTKSSSGWSSNTSSSLSQNDNYQVNPRKHSTRLTLLMKDNSISSLDSIDSTKSDDMRFSRQKDRPQQTQRTAKLLSPISDKSPLDPSSSSIHTLDQKDGWLSHCYSYGEQSQSGMKATSSLQSGAVADQLAVPWEMPKLRRRLALLADSGISLDFPGGEVQSKEPQFESCPAFPAPRRSMKANLELRIPRMDSGEYMEELLPFGDPDHYREDNSKLRRQFPGSGAPDKAPGDKMRFDRCNMRLDFGRVEHPVCEIDIDTDLEAQEWFHGHITRFEAENILRSTKEGSFLVRNCESSAFNRYSLSLKSARGFIHIRIEPNSLGTFSLAEQQFSSVQLLVLHFMSNRLPIKGAEHVKLKYPVIIQLL